jgi:predicted TIM-barrel fold metal-dependent hydrolase
LRADAPHLVSTPDRGSVYVIPGLAHPIRLGFARPDDAAGAGPDASWHEIRAGAWDPAARLIDQDVDGVDAEVLFPTVGLALFRQPDPRLRAACADVYNDWIAAFVSAAPGRLLDTAIVTPTSPEDAERCVRRAAARGPAGLLVAMRPDGGDYHEPAWAPLFDALAAADLPVCFHSLGGPLRQVRGPRLAAAAVQAHDAQELLAVITLGAVLDRWPSLRVVIAESDASWLPHFVDRIDRVHATHGRWAGVPELERSPRSAIEEQVWFAFANDERAVAEATGPAIDRLMWGNDYPHTEGTWPRSSQRLQLLEATTSAHALRRFAAGNARQLFAIGDR